MRERRPLELATPRLDRPGSRAGVTRASCNGGRVEVEQMLDSTRPTNQRVSASDVHRCVACTLCGDRGTFYQRVCRANQALHPRELALLGKFVTRARRTVLPAPIGMSPSATECQFGADICIEAREAGGLHTGHESCLGLTTEVIT